MSTAKDPFVIALPSGQYQLVAEMTSSNGTCTPIDLTVQPDSYRSVAFACYS